MKSRVRENRTHGSVRGSRQAFHLNTMKGESRLSTRQKLHMNENEVMEMLAEDISRLRLPPISEKVLLAMREKRREILEMNKPPVPTEKPNKIIPTKYIFAAMLALLAVSVPIIVVMTNHSPISDLPNAPVLPGSSETVSVTESQIVTSTEEPKTTLEQIKLKQIYGEVTLSGKSEEELEMLLVTYSKENSVYEDDRYIYNFNSQGRLLEMRSLFTEFDKEFPVTKQVILDKVQALVKEYYSEWNEDYYRISIDNDVDGYPAWTVTITRDKDLLNETITMLFFSTGRLHWMRVDGTSNNVGVISKAEAVEIALKEIRKSDYGFQRFDDEEVDIIIECRNRDNQIYYYTVVDNIPLDKKTHICVCLEIDANTGNITNIVV